MGDLNVTYGPLTVPLVDIQAMFAAELLAHTIQNDDVGLGAWRSQYGTNTYAAVPIGVTFLALNPAPGYSTFFGLIVIGVVPTGTYDGLNVLPRAPFLVVRNPAVQDITISWLVLGH